MPSAVSGQNPDEQRLSRKKKKTRRKHVACLWLSYGWRCAHDHISQSAHIFSFASALFRNVRIEIRRVSSLTGLGILAQKGLLLFSLSCNISTDMSLNWYNWEQVASHLRMWRFT